MIIDRDKLGSTIVSLRKAAGLTQQQLADKIGVTNVTISHVENAASMPSLTALAEIADALDVTVGDLLDEGPTKLLGRITGIQRDMTKALTEVAALTQLLADRSERLADALGYDLALIPRTEEQP